MFMRVTIQWSVCPYWSTTQLVLVQSKLKLHYNVFLNQCFVYSLSNITASFYYFAFHVLLLLKVLYYEKQYNCRKGRGRMWGIGYWWSGYLARTLGLAPLLFSKCAMGSLMTTHSQNLGLMSPPNDRCSCMFVNLADYKQLKCFCVQHSLPQLQCFYL